MATDDKRLERIEDKVDKIDTTLTEIGKDVAYHIKRTDLLEAELKPLKTRMDMIMGAVKLITVAGGIVALIEAIRLFK